MEYYRLGYTRLFLTKGIEHIEYNNDKINSIGLDIVIMPFDKEGNEFLFEGEKAEQRLYFENGDSAFLSDFYNVYFDKNSKNLFTVELNQKLCFLSGYDFKYKITNYWYYEKELGYPIEITEKEFINLLKFNIDKWDCTDNYPTQSNAYFIEEVSVDSDINLAKNHPVVNVKREYNLNIAVDNNGNVEIVKNIKNGILDEKNIRPLAIQYINENNISNNQFILLDMFENGRHTGGGKMYFSD